jgi:phosphatidyl-myo-inositol alpha-mannosyltransferase
VKVAIVVPYSWSFWGGVVEHADHQCRALRALGHDAWILMGSDPPGRLSAALHPRAARSEPPPPYVRALGRSVIVPANASHANIVLSPSAIVRLRRLLRREQFDVIHAHEPLTPVIGAAALLYAEAPIVATFHAAGPFAWRAIGQRSWGFLLERIDRRIAVSDAARETAAAYSPGDYEIIPNGVVLPPEVDVAGRHDRVVYVGRHEARKGLGVLLEAWPQVHAASGVRLRVVGADPLAVRLLMSRRRLPGTGVDILGVLTEQDLTAELLEAKALVAPSIRAESFGMVLTRALACATPVVASDIDGYNTVVDGDVGLLVPPGDPDALASAILVLLADESRRQALGEQARVRAESFSWERIARRLAHVYSDLHGLGSPEEPTSRRA